MRTPRPAFVTTVLAAPLILVSWAAAQTSPALTTLHFFAGPPDGELPVAGLVAGANGVFYGTTKFGGAYGNGSVYQLTAPAAGGSWTETLLYSFKGPTVNDGEWPYASLVIGNDGSLYGTTLEGGAVDTCGSSRCGGTVFKLSPPRTSSGKWTETVLHSFPSADGDGTGPWGGLVIGANGALYGTTQTGGIESTPESFGYGTVFEMTPPAAQGGAWTETVLYRFNGANGDGYGPVSNLVFGATRELYGTTPSGGSAGFGTVFELTPPGATGRTWTETILYNFSGQAPDGGEPSSAVVIGKDGWLYGTAGNPSSALCTAFELKPPAASGGLWSENTLYTFEKSLENQNGFAPNGLVFGANGLLYGTAMLGGASDLGNVYQLEPAAGGTWTYTVLYSFDGTDGSLPNGVPIVGSDGNLYGTTHRGNTSQVNMGTVFQLVP